MTPQGIRFWLGLTPRQRQVLEAICASGEGYRQLAQRLGMAGGTLKQRVWEMLQMSGTDDRFGLAMFAWRHGILPCPCERGPADVGEGDPGGSSYGGA